MQPPKRAPTQRIGQGDLHGTPGVWGCCENDGAAIWYCSYPSDGTNKSKGRCPSGVLRFKTTLRLVYGAGIYASHAPPWIHASANGNYVASNMHQTFLQMEQQHKRLPNKW
jgi:hypothetical protein